MSYYSESLKHPRWQKKRLEVLAAHHWRCDACKATDVPLHIHHTYYEWDKLAWEYENATLRCLCSNCHKAHHQRQDVLRRVTGHCTPLMLERLIQYAIDCMDNDDTLILSR